MMIRVVEVSQAGRRDRSRRTFGEGLAGAARPGSGRRVRMDWVEPQLDLVDQTY
jgi:hypothetical protein